ncbi:MAG TPA: methyltransferase domain-containing protein [Xanthobacteraceae bacterium]|jgi:SAM-dependent methyltransferase
MPIYSNDGNPFVAAQVPLGARRILDIGCGCGDIGAFLKTLMPELWIEGITSNPLEADKAAVELDRVHIFDIEKEPPADLNAGFDCLLFSHVLEHLREPAQTVLRLLPFLVPGGTLVIAVPNILEWRTRLRLLSGDFTYADYGILDRTHLKFFTFDSADQELLSSDVRDSLVEIRKVGDGAVPLGPLRHLKVLDRFARAIDRMGVAYRPNLFSQQVVIVARKAPERHTLINGDSPV